MNSITKKRVLLKISGEALSSKDNILSRDKIAQFAQEIKSIYELGTEVVVVIGGGNIIRGSASQELFDNRYKADNIGMLATIINALTLEEALGREGINATTLTAVEMNKISEFFTAQRAIEYLNKNKIIICSGGIGNPYFSTDTGTIVRALETKCDIVLKGTQVDGVYCSDPKKNPLAIKYSTISYDDFISQNLQVMDITAITLAKKHNLPIIIFNIHNQGSLKQAVLQEGKQSIIYCKQPVS